MSNVNSFFLPEVTSAVNPDKLTSPYFFGKRSFRFFHFSQPGSPGMGCASSGISASTTLWVPSTAPSPVPNVDNTNLPEESVTPDAGRPRVGMKATLTPSIGLPRYVTVPLTFAVGSEPGRAPQPIAKSKTIASAPSITCSRPIVATPIETPLLRYGDRLAVANIGQHAIGEQIDVLRNEF